MSSLFYLKSTDAGDPIWMGQRLARGRNSSGDQPGRQRPELAGQMGSGTAVPGRRGGDWRASRGQTRWERQPEIMSRPDEKGAAGVERSPSGTDPARRRWPAVVGNGRRRAETGRGGRNRARGLAAATGRVEHTRICIMQERG